ncbi:DNA polymerase Y family protein [Hominifimenecus sp. rT4P-3]|uniref:DNA polymerase Y family protein n=1 Tax=Hominifimenecus sp. rT4P-3 TaxID=3242979 RepID=UPI003DA53F4D
MRIRKGEAMRQRTIFHVDVNSAFLSWKAVHQIQEQGSLVDLREIPSAVGGDEEKRHGIVLAKSIPAKRYGVRTGEPLVHARQKCPELVVVPPDFPLYVRYSKAFIDILLRFAPIVEQVSIDEAFCDMTGTERLYGPPAAFAVHLKDTIHKELGFTVNIGVSSNKLLAKMASDFEKPDKVHTLFPEEIQEKMWPLPVGRLYFVGESAEKKLKSLGIHTIGDLAVTDLSILRSHLKKHGETIWHYANGMDDTPVLAEPEETKCYGNSTTISHDVTRAEEAKQILLSLTETVAARLRADQKKAARVSISIVSSNFINTSHQATLDSPTDVTSELYAEVCSLFDQLWEQQPIRLLSVQTSRLCQEEIHQFSLFDNPEKREKLAKLDNAVDQIRSKFGEDAVKRACFLDGTRHMTGGLNAAKREQRKQR